MRILSKKEMLKTPVGTVFALYEPDILYEGIRIKTSCYTIKRSVDDCDDEPHWDSELFLMPACAHDKSDRNFCYTNWLCIDNVDDDYDDKQLFAVFSNTEVIQMINALQWALTGCKSYFDQDQWYSDDDELPIDDNAIEEITGGDIF